jgi:hypothetical protein
MAILRERTVWRRAVSEKRARSGLDRAKQANVVKALRFLRARYGSWAETAKMLGTTVSTLYTVTTPAGTRRIGAGIALRAATVAGVTVDDVLTGAWPPVGACAHCGRCGSR